MKKLIASALLCVASVLPVGASADTGDLLSYNYADVTYDHTYIEPRFGLDDADGGNLTLSYSPIEYFFAKLGYSYDNSGITGAGVNLNLHTFTYGGGAYYDITDTLHLVGSVAGVFADVDSGGDDNGIQYEALVRALVADAFEANLGARYDDLDEFGNTWTYFARALVPVTCGVAALAGVAINEDDDTILEAGLRFNF